MSSSDAFDLQFGVVILRLKEGLDVSHIPGQSTPPSDSTDEAVTTDRLREPVLSRFVPARRSPVLSGEAANWRSGGCGFSQPGKGLGLGLQPFERHQEPEQLACHQR